MRLVRILLVLQLVASSAFAAESILRVLAGALRPSPAPVTNNAVAAVTANGHSYLVSFNGLARGRAYSDTLSSTYVLDVERNEWTEAAPVPGGVGRLASAAVSVGSLAYVFGGYSVAEDGAEVSTPWAHSFDPETEVFIELSPMPVPVDDAVAVTYADRYIYLISGWHDLGNVNLVQRYDTDTDTWSQATPTPGPAVFGHSGGIVGNTIVYCDGVAVEARDDRPRDFVAVPDCLLGVIDDKDSRRIDWRTVKYHPGLPRYRMAAAGVPAANGVLFIGGSVNPYNYDGIGYNGKPSEPASGALLFDIDDQSWRVIDIEGDATMEQRGLCLVGGKWIPIGGMATEQRVTDRVVSYRRE